MLYLLSTVVFKQCNAKSFKNMNSKCKYNYFWKPIFLTNKEKKARLKKKYASRHYGLIFQPPQRVILVTVPNPNGSSTLCKFLCSCSSFILSRWKVAFPTFSQYLLWRLYLSPFSDHLNLDGYQNLFLLFPCIALRPMSQASIKTGLHHLSLLSPMAISC